MGIKERRQRERRELREGILAAGREIASKEGWQALTIRKVAALVEFSPPMIYQHFDSKDAILLELMRRGYAQQREAVEAARDAASGPEEALLAMGRAWLAFAFGSPDLYQVMYGLGGVPFLASRMRKEGEEIGTVMGDVIAQVLQESGTVAHDLQGKVTLLWATGHGLAALVMVGRLPGGEPEAMRLGEQATREHLVAWRGG